MRNGGGTDWSRATASGSGVVVPGTYKLANGSTVAVQNLALIETGYLCLSLG